MNINASNLDFYFIIPIMVKSKCTRYRVMNRTVDIDEYTCMHSLYIIDAAAILR